MPRGSRDFLRCIAGLLLPVTLAISADNVNQQHDNLISTPATDVLEEVIVTAPEPRYVAPTRRDRIGRIWAPVYINDKGPFRLVLDTGANRSALTASVMTALGLSPNKGGDVRLRGVTGTTVVPTVTIDTLLVGELLLKEKRLPIIPDALGGAEGILGNEGMTDKRIYIDFAHDLIVINRSHNERAETGFITIPFKLTHGNLLTVAARMGSTRVQAIIDTGGQATIANLAARDALFRKPDRTAPSVDIIVGATTDEQQGEGRAAPAITLGDIEIRSSHMTFGDMHIFEHWKLTQEPAVLIGMEVLGLLDTLIIDYKRKELQIRTRSNN